MELLQLKYFQKVASLEHVTKAAKELLVAQPALSKTIRMLEDELGVSLFDREGKYIRLNSYGRLFLKKVDTALAALEDGKRELKSMKTNEHEVINLAFLAASPHLPELLRLFTEKYPCVNFNLLQHLPKYQNNEFDICISGLPLNFDGVASVPLINEAFYLAVPVMHPLANRNSIKLQEVSNEKFINLKKESAFRQITDSFCEQAGFTPRIAFESDDPATVRGLIRAGQGVGFIPAISWNSATGPSVRLLEIEEPVCNRTIWLSVMKERYHSNIVLLFKDFTMDYFKKLNC